MRQTLLLPKAMKVKNRVLKQHICAMRRLWRSGLKVTDDFVELRFNTSELEDICYQESEGKFLDDLFELCRARAYTSMRWSSDLVDSLRLCTIDNGKWESVTCRSFSERQKELKGGRKFDLKVYSDRSFRKACGM
jgi:hypothetical protein